MATAILSAARLRELLNYDQATGAFTWRVNKSARARAGARAGCLDPAGYWQICVDGKNYRGHVLAWLYAHGEWPPLIDHINGLKADNRIENLRLGDKSLNAQNLKRPNAGNSSGYLGVSRTKAKRWLAQLKVNGKHVLSKAFDTPEEAHAAYLEAKRIHHPGCTI